jgi:hypothetical protein
VWSVTQVRSKSIVFCQPNNRRSIPEADVEINAMDHALGPSAMSGFGGTASTDQMLIDSAINARELMTKRINQIASSRNNVFRQVPASRTTTAPPCMR